MPSQTFLSSVIRSAECRVCQGSIHAGIACEAGPLSGSPSHLEQAVWQHNHALTDPSQPT
jgi:hypothetical protein